MRCRPRGRWALLLPQLRAQASGGLAKAKIATAAKSHDGHLGLGRVRARPGLGVADLRRDHGQYHGCKSWHGFPWDACASSTDACHTSSENWKQ